MGYIKESTGVDFTVDPTPLTAEDKKKISEIIAYYKTTGKKLSVKLSAKKNLPRRDKKKILV
ncbi:MAG: hypothetical protein LBE36_11030 [Flavobacteriaceae bacterium]|jgi:hypothetical protein|nr:hypothetical protein [Flavobacteriaceae bacterium]